ncbi:MAG: FimB/Mfa2 family fimbrial subunit, partial [Muribaculaceae bacterium]|nr:FimB/Mfa2 family fimbrial subunit [Muribaculaceae bacterium]
AVTLYAVDSNGDIVWKRSESGSALKSDGYMMDLDVPPGRYTLVAWCGDGVGSSFTVNDTDRADQLHCVLNHRGDDNGVLTTDEHLRRLYHGRVVDVELPDRQGVHVVEMTLMKNTNTVRFLLQHLSGEPVDKDKFVFTITDRNRRMEWNNDLVDQTWVRYSACHTSAGTAGIIDPGNLWQSSFSAAVAEISTGRLIAPDAGRRGPAVPDTDKPRLTVTRRDNGEVVLSVPYIDYCLMVKGRYEDTDDWYEHPMSDQEYLDRQDEYNMTFFLDEGDRWLDTYIYINSWHLVIQHTGLGD